ncbi:MAG: hypothetical protein LJF06_13415 [Gemmatimonadetes bacterium]|nr:hypothetical protein [Gemmatimonadota bacterium]
MYDRAASASLILGAALVASGSHAPRNVAVPGDGHPAVSAVAGDIFLTSDRCLACHKGVRTSVGEDVSIGYAWRPTMMANGGRDPYWQAAVRREITDHPEASAEIQNECSRCHMPMASVVGRVARGMGAVFANLPVGSSVAPEAALAGDGVACAACHQISDAGLGTEESFVGGFQISLAAPVTGRPVFGPFAPDPGGAAIMRSATSFVPTEGTHVQSPDLCATCHTLLTHSVLPGGASGPQFPEQAPYLEWQASSYATGGKGCQACHMPEVGEPVPVTAVLGRARPNVSQHSFRGGNFFILRVLNRYGRELGVAALPQELAAAADRTEAHLRDATATLTVTEALLDGDRLRAEVEVRNRTGHKFPTAYPSRRAWLHVTVTDASGRKVFESGAFSADGHVAGNDNDADGTRFEPHYAEITSPDQVQVYEAIMVDGAGLPTTGLLMADHWAKENRLLPVGFDEARADPRVLVRGAATRDADFTPGGDRVRYAVPVDPGAGPFTVEAELWYQPIAYRWATNLASYDTFETRRFVRYYREMARGSAIVLASGSARVR